MVKDNIRFQFLLRASLSPYSKVRLRPTPSCYKSIGSER